MFLAPLSEFYGRRIVYIIAFGMYLIWLIPCALAPNIGAMLVVRFLDGLAVSETFRQNQQIVADEGSREVHSSVSREALLETCSQRRL